MYLEPSATPHKRTSSPIVEVACFNLLWRSNVFGTFHRCRLVRPYATRFNLLWRSNVFGTLTIDVFDEDISFFVSISFGDLMYLERYRKIARHNWLKFQSPLEI
mgnify:CR=1 FL=1